MTDKTKIIGTHDLVGISFTAFVFRKGRLLYSPKHSANTDSIVMLFPDGMSERSNHRGTYSSISGASDLI